MNPPQHKATTFVSTMRLERVQRTGAPWKEEMILTIERLSEELGRVTKRWLNEGTVVTNVELEYVHDAAAILVEVSGVELEKP